MHPLESPSEVKTHTVLVMSHKIWTPNKRIEKVFLYVEAGDWYDWYRYRYRYPQPIHAEKEKIYSYLCNHLKVNKGSCLKCPTLTTPKKPYCDSPNQTSLPLYSIPSPSNTHSLRSAIFDSNLTYGKTTKLHIDGDGAQNHSSGQYRDHYRYQVYASFSIDIAAWMASHVFLFWDRIPGSGFGYAMWCMRRISIVNIFLSFPSTWSGSLAGLFPMVV